MSRRRKRLSEDDLAVWSQAARSILPLRPRTTSDAVTEPVAKQPDDAPKAPIARFEVGRKNTVHRNSVSLTSTLQQQLQTEPVRMDAKTLARMKRGKLKPEAKLDLHGMTLAQAQPALTRFILRKQGDGCRLVIVVTGKGRVKEDEGPIPMPRGLLRHHVPQWLSSGSLRSAVLQVTPAHMKHGGAGAYYVYLRRLGR